MAELIERKITIGLLWHSITSDNLGVGALTLSHMAIITEAACRVGAQVRFVVIGTQGRTPYPIQVFEIVGCVKFSLKSLSSYFDSIRLLRQCDIVFDIGEGDSFADIYGKKRILTQAFSKLLVRILRKPLILSPQTIGPFNSIFGKCFGKIGLSMANRIYARDHLSMQYLRHMGYHNKSSEIIDVAFDLPFERPSRENNTSVRVGINVSGLLYNGGYTGRNEFGLALDYRALIEGSCEFFLAHSGVKVYLVPHVISDTVEAEDDLRVSNKLIERYPELRLAPRFFSPIEAKSFISGLDFFTGARMHACIAAFSSGVPVLPMAYSRKFNGLFNSLKYPHVVDCLNLDTTSALQMLSQAFEHRAQLAIEIEAGNHIAQAKLESYTKQISELF
ncbi:MAG: polysaccharide pyruvyl transferase family protein [Dehalococcoidia bacterium]|nr:polysaccharide pyruvyl transferase family protein [Dehalococcoidia bacterium]